jgi:hypothetical protein
MLNAAGGGASEGATPTTKRKAPDAARRETAPRTIPFRILLNLEGA